MPRHTPRNFKIESGVALTKPKDALIAKAADAFQRGEHDSREKAGYAILADYYGSGVWVLTDKQQDRKAKYLGSLIKALIQRSDERS